MSNNKLTIAVSSGKGGTGKTFVSTNLAFVLKGRYEDVTYLDCDVEEPNGHLFLKQKNIKTEDISIMSPVGMDPDKCTLCGKCVEACTYNAIMIAGEKIMLFNELCHVCGACVVVCPENAVIEKQRQIGLLRTGSAEAINCVDAVLKTGEGGMSARLINRVKGKMGEGVNVLDSPPGTACSAVETVKDADLCVLVTDPTPFGINDLKLSVEMVRKIGLEPVIVVNRADYRDNKLKEYCEAENLQIIGEIPDSRKIAEIYSWGGLAAREDEGVKKLFEAMAERILERASLKLKSDKKFREGVSFKNADVEKAKAYIPSDHKSAPVKELLVISGKGGTGKTSITAAFASLMKNKVVGDCDVDAADLHLILKPEIKAKGYFSGGVETRIDPEKCTGCGACMRECRFSAIKEKRTNAGLKYEIDPVACEGCGVCGLVCRFDAVSVKDAINGEWYTSDTRVGPFSHAMLGIAEENSGRLVTLVKNKAVELAGKTGIKESLLDGSPGTGCPVIASLNGARYAVIVTEPTVSGIHDLERILDVTAHFNVESGVIVNKHDLNTDNSRKIDEICRKRGAGMLGRIPYDTIITEAQMKGLSIIEMDREAEVSKKIQEIFAEVQKKIGDAKA
ncbi:MAG: P-loop NTPase [Elusimicrobiota bacterium]|nr:P-loop NTPase [Elusimicrobiota bacterium]